MDVFPFLNFYSQDDPYRFRHVDDYSLKTNFAGTTNSIPLDIKLSPSLAAFKSGMNDSF